MITTKKDFEKFKKSARHYIDLLNLYDWSICFEHKKIAGCYAKIYVDFGSKCARMIMSTTLSDRDADGFDPWEHGKHEVCELLLMNLSSMSKSFYSNEHVEECVHTVINRLIKALP